MTKQQTMKFNEITGDWIARTEAKLDQVLPATNELPMRLHEAMRYSVLNGGKRIRPILVYATGTALGVPLDALDGPRCRDRTDARVFAGA